MSDQVRQSASERLEEILKPYRDTAVVASNAYKEVMDEEAKALHETVKGLVREAIKQQREGVEIDKKYQALKQKHEKDLTRTLNKIAAMSRGESVADEKVEEKPTE